MKDEVRIIVCGSCLLSEKLNSGTIAGNGGYGVVIYVNKQRNGEVSGGFSNTTHARMEIRGIIEGLRHLKNSGDITVFILNKNIIDTFTKGWLEKWKHNGFKKIKNVDLWKELDSVINVGGHNITFEYSHSLRNSADFMLAEQMAKTVVGRKNLPNDLPAGTMIFVPNMENNNVEITDNKPVMESVCVDASTSVNPGITEYRAVDTLTHKVIFNYKLQEATNNIGEFLGIVHTLALFKNANKPLKIIYSDSQNAILWIKQKNCKTKLAPTDRNRKTFDVIERAVNWLKNNDFDTQILKWNTPLWGEIPADYGRK